MKKIFRKFLSLLISFNLIFLNFLPYFPLVKTNTVLAADSRLNFNYLQEENSLVINNNSHELNYSLIYLKNNGVLENLRGKLKAGDNHLFFGTKSGNVANLHDFQKAVLKVQEESGNWTRQYQLEKKDNTVYIVSEEKFSGEDLNKNEQS